MTKTNFAIIGCGEVAQKHKKAIDQVGGEILYACDVDIERAKQFSNKIYVDYKHLLENPSIDVVSICTPNYLHVPVAIDALNAGKRVILEKPLGINVEQSLILTSHPLADRVAVCYQRRFNFLSRHINKYKDDIEKIDAQVFVRRDEGYWNSWRSDKEKSGGGNLINIDIHFFDLFQWWLGKEYEVTFAKLAYRNGIDEAVMAQVDFKGIPVTFFGTSLHTELNVNISIYLKSGRIISYHNYDDDATHYDVYNGFINTGEYIGVQDALTSLQIVEEVYEKANNHNANSERKGS